MDLHRPPRAEQERIHGDGEVGQHLEHARRLESLVALCGLAQGDFDGPLLASLDIMMAPTASRVAAVRLKAFSVALASAGLRLAPPAGDAAGRLN